jgi:hypothetical protein
MSKGKRKVYPRRVKECIGCHDVAAIIGRGLCRQCYTTPARECVKCRDVKKIYAHGHCRACYRPPIKKCCVCGAGSTSKQCRKCYYESNKQRLLEQQHERYHANRDEIRKEQRQRYASDAALRQRARDNSNRYRLENRETVLQRKKNWYNNNRDRHYEKVKQYRERHPELRREEYRRKREREGFQLDVKPHRGSKSAFVVAPYETRREYMRQYVTNRRRHDKAFQLIARCRLRVRRALSRHTKSAKTLELIGCTASELKVYIESKFQPGMSWDCIERIHIDHVRPLASFDLSNPEHQRVAFHYTNLQPLWAEDNLKKSSMWLDKIA